MSNEFLLDDTESELINVRGLVDLLIKWWLPIFLIITLIMTIAAYLVFRMTPMYKATATLEVKQQERQIIEVAGIESVNADGEFLATQIELFKSQALIKDVIDKSNILSDRDFIDFSAPELQSLPREDKMRLAVADFSDRLNVSLIGVSRLIKVSFEHKNPKRAAAIVNSLTDEFIYKDLERKLGGTVAARDFLENRIEIVKQSLEQSERDLSLYASDNNIIIIKDELDQGQEATQSLDKIALVTLNADLTQAQTERLIAERNYLTAQQNPQSSSILASPALNSLKAELTSLETEYSEKLETFYPGYPDMLELQSKIDVVKARISSNTGQMVDTSLAELKAKFDLADAKAANLSQRVANLKNSVFDLREKRVDYNILKRQVDTERTQYDALLQRLKEISVTDEIGESLVQLVDKAEPPRNPFAPNKPLLLLLALVLSSTATVGGLFLVEIIDDRIKTPDDVKKKLKSIILGVIPMGDKNGDPVDILGNPQSGVSESYASLRTNLKMSGNQGGPRIVHLTSTRSGEGKSFSSLGLAIRYAGLGGDVLLIDADMRLPTFENHARRKYDDDLPSDYEEDDYEGLSGLLTSNSNLVDKVLKTKIDNLYLLPSGDHVPNPTELLSGPRILEIFEQARERFDYVIIDSPPVLGLADALILGAAADATILMVESEKIRTPAVRSTLERLRNSDAKLLGVVLTKYKANKHGYTDYYQYSYGDGDGTHVKKKSKLAKQKAKRKIDLISTPEYAE